MIRVLEAIGCCILIVVVVYAVGILLALAVTILPASWNEDDGYPE